MNDMNLNNLLEIPSHFQTSKKPLVTSKIVMNHLCLALYLQLLLTKRVELIILLDTPISPVHYSSLQHSYCYASCIDIFRYSGRNRRRGRRRCVLATRNRGPVSVRGVIYYFRAGNQHRRFISWPDVYDDHSGGPLDP